MTAMPTNSLCDLEKLLLFSVKKKKKISRGVKTLFD